MTTKEAKEILEKEKPLRVFGYEDLCDAYDVAIEALEKQAISAEASDKYRIHYLRKDPDNLPPPYGENNESYEVFVYGKYENCVAEYDYESKKWYEPVEYRTVYDVIAWKEIEPLEEE